MHRIDKIRFGVVRHVTIGELGRRQSSIGLTCEVAGDGVPARVERPLQSAMPDFELSHRAISEQGLPSDTGYFGRG